MSEENAEMAKPGFVSAQHVAKRAGVSRSAVSRTFTPGASISPQTREKVLRAAEELGYHVNDLARGLLAKGSRLVGLIVTKPEVGFRAHLMASLVRALIRRGSVPVIIDTGQTEPELEVARKALFGHRAEATIILSGSPPSSFVDLARSNGQPLIVIGRSESGCDHIGTDNASAAREAAALLVASGFRKLGLAGSRSGTPSIVEREDAFRAEASRRGAETVWERGGDSDYAGGQEVARLLLNRPERPQAIFCVNDLIAFGVMDVARHELGLSLPRDLSVIGFDDVPEAAWNAYRLTTFRQDPDAMAAKAMEALDRRQRDPQMPPIVMKIPAPLMRRQSSIAA